MNYKKYIKQKKVLNSLNTLSYYIDQFCITNIQHSIIFTILVIIRSIFDNIVVLFGNERLSNHLISYQCFQTLLIISQGLYTSATPTITTSNGKIHLSIESALKCFQESQRTSLSTLSLEARDSEE